MSTHPLLEAISALKDLREDLKSMIKAGQEEATNGNRTISRLLITGQMDYVASIDAIFDHIFAEAEELSRLRKENEKLRGAIEVFALYPDMVPDAHDNDEVVRLSNRQGTIVMRVKDFRRAKAVLEGKE